MSRRYGLFCQILLNLKFLLNIVELCHFMSFCLYLWILSKNAAAAVHSEGRNLLLKISFDRKRAYSSIVMFRYPFFQNLFFNFFQNLRTKDRKKTKEKQHLVGVKNSITFGTKELRKIEDFYLWSINLVVMLLFLNQSFDFCLNWHCNC